MTTRRPQKQKKQSDKQVKKRERDFLEGYDCLRCKHFKGKKRGCTMDFCCFEDEKLNAIINNKIKRKRDSL